MPVRLLRRLTGTALRAAFRSPPAREGFPFPPGPPSPPQRAFIQEDGKTTHHKVRRSVCRSPGGAGGLFSFLLALACGFSPASGCGSLRGWRQGVRGASPSTPPTTPVLPCPRGGGRPCRMTYTLSAARRRGQVGAHLPAPRVICAPAAALPLRGDRFRAPAR